MAIFTNRHSLPTPARSSKALALFPTACTDIPQAQVLPVTGMQQLPGETGSAQSGKVLGKPEPGLEHSVSQPVKKPEDQPQHGSMDCFQGLTFKHWAGPMSSGLLRLIQTLLISNPKQFNYSANLSFYIGAINDLRRPCHPQHSVHLIRLQLVAGCFPTASLCSKDTHLSPLKGYWGPAKIAQLG